MSSLPSELTAILIEYDDVFKGVGRLPGKHKITLHDNVTPFIASARKIPLALEDKVKAELDRLLKDGIIAKVEEPTDWVNPIVVVPKKDNSIRICLDPRHLNKAIKRQHFQIPSQEFLLSKLQGSQLFTVLDAREAFYHLELDEESSKLCTFITPFGRYQFLVMPFGLSCAPEIFQMAMSRMFENNPKIHPYFDDIVIGSKDIHTHCKHLKEVLQIARQNNLKFNIKKAQFAVPQIAYLGHIVSATGLTPDPRKIKAISDFPVPRDRQELMRFLGMVTYLMKFTPNYSTETKELRELLKKDTAWNWDANSDRVFTRVKFLLRTTPILQLFDPRKPIQISVDASSYGLGGVLLQDNKPIAFTSAALSETQSRYSQIEKELLAIVHACERFNYFLYGQQFEVQTDHKPLLGLIKKPYDSISPRLQRLLIRLQSYSFKLSHVPGKNLIVADALSRAPLKEKTANTEDVDEARVLVSLLDQTTTLKLEEIRQISEYDPELKAVKKYILDGWPQHRAETDVKARPFWHCQSELNIEDGLICRGSRLVIPQACRKDILQRLHVGHRGIVSCKNLARESLYWPGLNVDIENMISHCLICQQHQKQNAKEPLLDRDLPNRPWQKVGIDFFHFQSVTYLLVIDYFSKYIELQHLHNTNAHAVIQMLKTCFARFGIPEEIVSDNGPPFDSEEFRSFTKEWNIFYNPASPYYPRSNGQVERCIQTLKSSLRKAALSHSDVHLVLLDYRTTPMDGMPSPSEALMGRRIRTLIPTLPRHLQPQYDCQGIKDRLIHRQQRQHRYGDQHTKHLNPLSQNQDVWFRHGNRWLQGTISQVGPQPRSYVITSSNGKQYRRNRLHIKPLKAPNQAVGRTAEDLLPTFSGQEEVMPVRASIQPTMVSFRVPQNRPITTRSGREVRKPQRLEY